MDTVFDPLRRKEVTLTPEEKVRQWFIQLLGEQMQVPFSMMMSEVPFRLGEKNLRADIVVWARDLSPMMIVECKRPSVALTQDVLDQILRYLWVMDAPFFVATNGQNTYICKRTPEGPQWLPSPPTYAQMLEYYEQYHHGRVSGA